MKSLFTFSLAIIVWIGFGSESHSSPYRIAGNPMPNYGDYDSRRGRFHPVEILKTDSSENVLWSDIIHLPDAQRLSYGADTVIALIDSGVDLSLDPIQSVLWKNPDEVPGDFIDNDGNGYVDDVNGYDFGDNAAKPQDYNGHGTMMASIIRQVAPLAKIMVLKINPGGDGSFSEAALVEALMYANTMGAQVINLSLTISKSTILDRTIQMVYDSGCVMNAAAGNGGENTSVGYPASMSETIAVASLYDENQIASWISPQGDALDIVLPGVAIPTTGIGGINVYTTGTSVSTAMASGIAAIISYMDVSLKGDGVRKALLAGVRDLGEAGKDPIFGYGAVDGYELYQAATQTIGETIGNHTYSVASHVPLKLCVLPTPINGETPTVEWFALTAVVGGQPLPVYVFDSQNLVEAIPGVDLTRYGYPYTAGKVNVIATLSMADLGLSVGDTLRYAYAYSTLKGDIRFPEIVTVVADR